MGTVFRPERYPRSGWPWFSLVVLICVIGTLAYFFGWKPILEFIGIIVVVALIVFGGLFLGLLLEIRKGKE